ncbi:hypothetical protein B9479_005522 [Cryptococcus floricola]|uniref:Protein kinase domain-containing protein n=1 Tax=Cryptococcus floricola TaxID=2591691 RepID=A0A5D3AVJ9_9TREE|nr:hypothetical protein B9479_005522 [Cryptococcus floricola]
MPSSDATTSHYGAPTEWIKSEPITSAALGPLYLALDLRNGRLMMVKEIEDGHDDIDERQEDRVYMRGAHREVAEMAGWKKESIVECLGSETHTNGGEIHVFFELVPVSLQDLLGMHAPFPEDLVKVITRDILGALADVHNAGYTLNELGAERVRFGDDGKAKVYVFGATSKAKDTFPFSSISFIPDREARSLNAARYQSEFKFVGALVLKMLQGEEVIIQHDGPKGPPPAGANTLVQRHLSLQMIPPNLSPECRGFLKAVHAADPAQDQVLANLQMHPFIRDNGEMISKGVETSETRQHIIRMCKGIAESRNDALL